MQLRLFPGNHLGERGVGEVFLPSINYGFKVVDLALVMENSKATVVVG